MHERTCTMQDSIHFTQGRIQFRGFIQREGTIFEVIGFCLGAQSLLITPRENRAQSLFHCQINDKLTCVSIGTVDQESFHVYSCHCERCFAKQSPVKWIRSVEVFSSLNRRFLRHLRFVFAWSRYEREEYSLTRPAPLSANHSLFTKCTSRSASSYPSFQCAAMLVSFSSQVSDAISLQPFSRAHCSAACTSSLPSFCPRTCSSTYQASM